MRCIFLIIFLFILISPAVGQEEKKEEEGFEYKTLIRTVNGINFDIPEDRPIEKRGGIVAPMEVDKYVALKFSKLEERLQNMEDSIKRIEEELNLIRDDMKFFKEEGESLKESSSLDK